MTQQPSKRREAIVAVCQSLPDHLYERFKERMQERVWFTPSLGLGGCAKDVPQHKMIYISPIWEAADDELVQYIVLHEMLHVILDHNTDLNRHNESECQLDDQQEREVDERIVQLGFVDRRQEALDFVASVKSQLRVDPQ